MNRDYPLGRVRNINTIGVALRAHGSQRRAPSIRSTALLHGKTRVFPTPFQVSHFFSGVLSFESVYNSFNLK